MRRANNGLRKFCGCKRRGWAKCPHPWHMNYKPRGRSSPKKGGWRLSLDRHLRRHVADKTEAEREARKIRDAIDAGTFGAQATPPTPRRNDLTLRQLADEYVERHVDVKHKANR